METISLILLSLLLFAMWNGLVNKDHSQANLKAKRTWHLIGWIIRLLLVTVVFINSTLFFTWISILAAWHLYDIIITKIMGQKWYYTGTFSKMDKNKKITLILKIITLLIGVIFLI